MFLLGTVAWAALLAAPAASGDANAMMPANDGGEYTVASYYFPNYHPDARNQERKGIGWTEWELVKHAKPRFEGHQQPHVPLWGYTDESNPKDMAQKIDAAADHGIDVFIFDWYYYRDGLFLERGVEQGFMKAPNNGRLRFGLMWANHDWIEIHPARLNVTPEVVYPVAVTAETFDRMTDYVIETYFKHPSYWKIDGAPYFSIYELHTLIMGLGGVEQAANALARFREKTKAAGFPDLHLNAVVWGVQILPGETALTNPAERLPKLGFSSATSYVWVHHVALTQFPQTPYEQVMEQAVAHWARAAADMPVPYHPNVTMGWDSSPRCHPDDPFENKGYPFMASMSGNTPERFREALRRVKAFLADRPVNERIFTINCWNEWTEGSYLEPDTVNGMAYLEAVRDVFGANR